MTYNAVICSNMHTYKYMSRNIENLTNEELLDLFDGHKCSQENCAICNEHMIRFNPKRLIELGVDEDPQLEEGLLYDN